LTEEAAIACVGKVGYIAADTAYIWCGARSTIVDATRNA
jgi:hypothetical protein